MPPESTAERLGGDSAGVRGMQRLRVARDRRDAAVPPAGTGRAGAAIGAAKYPRCPQGQGGEPAATAAVDGRIGPVAWDRPYKKAGPVEKALDILRQEAGMGKLDRPNLDIFTDAKVYEMTPPRAEAEATEIARG